MSIAMSLDTFGIVIELSLLAAMNGLPQDQ